MNALIHIARRAIAAAVAAANAMPVEVGLTLLSIASAIVMLVVFRAVTPPRWLVVARDRMAAAIYEMRLYLDFPRRVLRAQFDLIRFSLAYSAAMLPAVLILTVPFGLFILHGEAQWGLAPLDTGEPVLIRIDLEEAVEVRAQTVDCAKLTAPPMLLEDEATAYVRVELTQPVSCVLPIEVGSTVVQKRLDGAPSGAISPVRARGLALLTVITDEPPIEHPQVRSISVHHEPTATPMFGLTWPWWVHWLWLTFLFCGLLIKPLKITL